MYAVCLWMRARHIKEGCWSGRMVNGVFTYWWLIMSYQELIGCSVASLSTAWCPASGHWLHTSLQSLLSQYVPVLLNLLLCCSFSRHVLHLLSFYCLIEGTIFFQIMKRLGELKVFLWISFLAVVIVLTSSCNHLFIHQSCQILCFSGILIHVPSCSVSCCFLHYIRIYLLLFNICV